MPNKFPTPNPMSYLPTLAIAIFAVAMGTGTSLATAPELITPDSFYRRDSLMNNMLTARTNVEKAKPTVANDDAKAEGKVAIQPRTSFKQKSSSKHVANRSIKPALEIPPTRTPEVGEAPIKRKSSSVRLPKTDADLTAIASVTQKKTGTESQIAVPDVPRQKASRVDVRKVSASPRLNVTAQSAQVIPKLADTPAPAAGVPERVAAKLADVSRKTESSLPPVAQGKSIVKRNAAANFPVPSPDVDAVPTIPTEPSRIFAPDAPRVSVMNSAPIAKPVAESVVSPNTLNVNSTPFASSEPVPLMATQPVAIAADWPAVEGANAVFQPNRLFQQERGPAASCDRWPCNTCGQTFCCCPSACWGLRADALFLHRSRANGFDNPLVNCNCAVPTLLPPDSVSMGTESTPRFTVFRDNQCGGFDLEGTYYNVDHWTGSQRLEGPVIALGEDLGFGFADIRYESQLQNAELNLFKDWTNWTQFMLGFRWLELDERGSVTGSGDLIPVFDRRVEVQNTLLGGQVGLRKSIWDRGGFVTANATVKGGVFHNQMSRTTTGFGTSPLDKSGTSFVGELDFDLRAEITQCWSLNVGYQVLWLSDIAEALDQFFSPDQIFDDGSPIFHGLRVGVTRTF